MLHLSYGSELVRGLDYQILLNRPLTLLAESASLHHTPAAGCLSGGDVLVSLSQRAKFFLAQCGNECALIVLLHSVRATTLNRKDANNIRTVSFAFINQFALFSCGPGDVPVSNRQLMAELLFLCDF